MVSGQVSPFSVRPGYSLAEQVGFRAAVHRHATQVLGRFGGVLVPIRGYWRGLVMDDLVTMGMGSSWVVGSVVGWSRVSTAVRPSS